MVESETKKAKAVDYDKSHTTILTDEEVHKYPGLSLSRLTVVLSEKLHGNSNQKVEPCESIK